MLGSLAKASFAWMALEAEAVWDASHEGCHLLLSPTCYVVEGDAVDPAHEGGGMIPFSTTSAVQPIGS